MTLNFINFGMQEIIMLLMMLPIIFIIVLSLFHVISNQNISRSQRSLWFVFILFAPLVGSLIYWIVGRKQHTHKD